MKSPWLIFLVSLALTPLLTAEVRDWTSTEGDTIRGELQAFDGEEVAIQIGADVYRFSKSRLSEGDQAYLKEWAEEERSESSVPMEIGEWPESVEVPDDMEIEIVQEDRDADTYVYRSTHFEFRTSTRLSKSVVKEFAEIFEATFEVVKTLPIGLNPQTPEEGFYVTELFETQLDYYEAGGPPGSGGVYMGGSNKIMIPLPNLGVKNTGVRWIVEPDKANRTLMHEITHQVMHNWLSRMPIWFTEGMADYVESADYNAGRFLMKNMERRVEENVFRYLSESNFPMVPLDKLLTITHSEWNASLASGTGRYNYPSANLLTTYFLHLDGEGDAAHVASYLRALEEGTPPEEALQTHLIRGREVEELAEEVRDALRQAGIRIEYQS